MKKGLCLLVLLILMVGCQLDKDPFLGKWRADLESLPAVGSGPGDYWIITFYGGDNTFQEGGQIDSVPYLPREGYYIYTDTVLKLTYRDGEEWYITYAFYEEDTMIWSGPINLCFHRQ